MAPNWAIESYPKSTTSSSFNRAQLLQKFRGHFEKAKSLIFIFIVTFRKMFQGPSEDVCMNLENFLDYIETGWNCYQHNNQIIPNF